MFSLMRRELPRLTFPELFLTELGEEPGWFTSKEFVPSVEVSETNGELVLTAEIPGMTKEAIAIDLEGEVLTISGEKKDARESKEDGVFRSERRYGKFARAFTVPKTVDPTKVAATYTDGVLRVVLPKTAEAVARKIEISV
jgi:HSP20 family protein